jgi:aryl-alcohol dehydrogenase-like predicted oxidoreductase
MGAAFKQLKWRRGSYLVSTKFYWGLNDGVNEKNTLNRKRLIEGINGSLERFQLDYVDLIYCHRPDKTTPIEETVWAMHNIIEWGKAMYWGTSEWSAAEIVPRLKSPNAITCTSRSPNSPSITCSNAIASRASMSACTRIMDTAQPSGVPLLRVC